MHNISGIITSFKYNGDLKFLYLVGNFAFLPVEPQLYLFSGISESPFDDLTPRVKKTLKYLSFYGRVAYIETSYHGGTGSQASVVYENGRVVFGPLLSSDYEIERNKFRDLITDWAINEALRFIGIRRHEDKVDEFDTARLTEYRSNEDIFQEIAKKRVS